MSDKVVPERIEASLKEMDPEVFEAIENEKRRQADGLEMIASENFTYRAVLEATGSVFTNKYAEGYPGRRYYGGCEYADVVEQMAIDRALALFGADHVNVQPHSGSQANMAVYLAALQPGDTVLGMNLSHGGHLTHGHRLNFSGKYFNIVPYGVRPDTETIDYDAVNDLAARHRPALIVVGGSAYPRRIDYPTMGEIAERHGAKLMADIAHIAGLVATGAHPSPVPHCDFVTSTTHKTLRGPRSGVILCRDAYAKDIDRAVFPGVQGGPLVHVIAAKAVCFREAATPPFAEYISSVVENAAVLAETISAAGYRIVSGGTDTHLLLVDVFSKGVLGNVAETALDRAGITVNKNAIPFDQNPPLKPSGIRIGTPALTSRGMGTDQMRTIGGWIADVLAEPENAETIARVRDEVRELSRRFPLYT